MSRLYITDYFTSRKTTPTLESAYYKLIRNSMGELYLDTIYFNDIIEVYNESENIYTFSDIKKLVDETLVISKEKKNGIKTYTSYKSFSGFERRLRKDFKEVLSTCKSV